MIIKTKNRKPKKTVDGFSAKAFLPIYQEIQKFSPNIKRVIKIIVAILENNENTKIWYKSKSASIDKIAKVNKPINKMAIPSQNKE